MRMKKAVLVVVIYVMFLLSACNKGMPEVEEVEIKAITELTQENSFLQAKQLSDAAVDFYLGRTVNSEYDIVLYEVVPLGDDYNIIPLDSVESIVDTAVRKVAGMALQMLADAASSRHSIGEPSVEEDNPEDSDTKEGVGQIEGVVSQAAESHKVTTLGYSSVQIKSMILDVAAIEDVKLTEKQLKEAFFPDGKVPVAEVMGTSGITQEFRRWVLNTAQDAGLLDPRLFDTGDGWGVYAYACSDANGGKSFHVFDKIFTIHDSDIGDLADEIATSPKYTMICEDYKYFDNGGYQAVYRTDPNVWVDVPVRIVVSFTYTAVEGDYNTELEEFLAGVEHVFIQQK